ncbi:hypothetical protein LZ575_19720 [Antarcticibacterium sp. 1MA-6-2]|uniref:hypothetical protein n=1 Tax=Antarcticibacterium sp. 1MA-6-2 TaxID=2908210 RepID=UPI001F161813|nr:hypothetical protein [Antarcticibacterium sp. 1MA-6-2]UJH90902.1 hypothetical protein LZ575_19720 [Antarcticibacterium sp. 1MA-6-2]
MKKLLLPFLFLAFSLNAQQKETVDLKWKISDTLTYNTVMRDLISEDKEEAENDSVPHDMSGMLKAMHARFSNLKYETKLFPDKNGNVDIAVMLKKADADSSETFLSQLAKLNGNVFLRGKVSEEGELLSFYYNRIQSNYISFLFELPKNPVKVGDNWKLNVNMISLDPNFKADSLYRKNSVQLKDLKTVNGNKIAVIEYDLEEFVSGDFENRMMAMFSKEQAGKKRYMKMSYKAIGEFDIENGQWILYDGAMETETNFSPMGISGNKRTEFKLTPDN